MLRYKSVDRHLHDVGKWSSWMNARMARSRWAQADASHCTNPFADGEGTQAFIAPVLLVNARGRQFHLSVTQIKYDAPNAFTHYLDKAGDAPAPLNIDRDPELFALIVQYLSGYDILPLSATALPRTLSMEAAKRALVRDAELLQLSGLRATLLAAFAPPVPFLRWAGLSTRVANLSDILEGDVLSFRPVDKDSLSVPIYVHNFGIRYAPCWDPI
jgi:hypothetical protein